MKTRVGCLMVAVAGLSLWAGSSCPGPTDLGNGDQNTDPVRKKTLTITLYNDSCSTYIAPKFGVCPKGMPQPPHYFVEPPPVIEPGKSVTWTTDQIAGVADGDCTAFPETFTVGIPGWGYGPTSNPDTMTYVETRFVGFVGTQYHCGDTIRLRWSNCTAPGTAGTWTSEVEPAVGNPSPTSGFVSP